MQKVLELLGVVVYGIIAVVVISGGAIVAISLLLDIILGAGG